MYKLTGKEVEVNPLIKTPEGEQKTQGPGGE
jgi:hypothetical protein